MSSSTGATTFDGSASDPVAVLREVDALLTALAEPGLWTVADAELLRLTCAAESTRRKVEALRLGIVAEVSARDLARQAGARSTSEWLVQKTRVGRAEARRTVRAAERLSAHAPKVRDELAAGGIGLGHASAIADVMAILHSRATRFQSPVTYDVLRAAEATLLDLAATLDPAHLATAGTHLIDRVDPDWNPFDSDDAVLAQEAQREFTCTPRPDGGTRFSGGADPEGRAIIEAALSPLSAPRPTTAEGRDRRSPAQRRGEALVELCRRQLDAEDKPTEGGGAGTTVCATCTLEHLQGQLAEADPTLDFGTTIALESLRRLVCDAWT